MMARSYNDPFWSLFDRLDRFAERPFASYTGGGDSSTVMTASCPVNVAQDQDHYFIQALVPGLAAEQLELTWDKTVLTISGKVAANMPENATPVWREIHPYQFRRSIQLGSDVAADRIEAKLEHGVLTIVAPKAETAKVRAIPVQVAGTQQPTQPVQIEG